MRTGRSNYGASMQRKALRRMTPCAHMKRYQGICKKKERAIGREVQYYLLLFEMIGTHTRMLRCIQETSWSLPKILETEVTSGEREEKGL